MPRKTQQARADELGITKNVLQNARNAGVNIWNEDEMKSWMGKRRPRAGNKKQETKKTTKPRTGSADDVTVEQLEKQVKAAETYEEVRTIKEKIVALLQAQKVRKEEGQLIARAKVDERDTRIAAAVKGSLLKFCNDVPPMIEGQPAAKAQKTIKQQMMGVLEQLSNDQSEFWKEL